MKQTAILPLALVATGAFFALVAKVSSDYDHNTDFGKYHTYSWIKVQAQDTLWDDRIANAVDSQLTAKGWQKLASGGDASVAAFGATKNQRTIETWYDGIGGGWGWRRGWGGGGMATTTVENTPVGTLLVDIFDSQTKKLVWRGNASETLSGKPEKNEKKLNSEVQDLFKKFPPASKG